MKQAEANLRESGREKTLHRLMEWGILDKGEYWLTKTVRRLGCRFGRMDMGKCAGNIAKNLAIMAGFLAAASLFCYSIHGFESPVTDTGYVSMIFILAVFMTSRYTDGYVYGILASFLGVLGVNYVFTYPYMEFCFTMTGYPIGFASMLIISLITSAMMSEVKKSHERKLDVEREKMRSNLLRAVSHDIRTPLTSMLATVSLLEESEGEITPQERVALLEREQDDIQWLINFVENLLTVTRIDSSKKMSIVKKPEYIEEMVPGAVRKFRKRFPKTAVQVTIPDDPFPVPMDPILMEQVLVNLMENAVLHGGRGDDLKIEIIVEERLYEALITVRDNGQGIAPDILRRINAGGYVDPEPSDNRKNMGIGLTVCRAIVKAHGGEMEADNRELGGAQFLISLPLEDENAEQAAVSSFLRQYETPWKPTGHGGENKK